MTNSVRAEVSARARMLQGGRELPEQNIEEIKEFKGEKIFLKALGELAEARGIDRHGKRMRLEQVKKVLGK